MTPEEIAAESAKANAEAEAKKRAGQNKVWDNAEVQKIIAERQEAKDKLRKLELAEEKAQAKAKKEADDKLIADGKTSELLTTTQAELSSTKQRLEAFIAKETLRREDAIKKLTKPETKALAEKLTDADDILRLVELEKTENKIVPHNKLGVFGIGEKDAPKNFQEWQKLVEGA